MTVLEVIHETRYEYPAPVTLAQRAAALADRVGERFFTLAQGVDQRV